MPRIVILLVCLACSSVSAAEWSVADLGRLQKETHCMQASSQTFRSLLGEARVERLYATDWATYADGISGDHDALITCTRSGTHGARATLVIHARSRTAKGMFLRNRIVEIFDQQARAITQAWRDSFN